MKTIEQIALEVAQKLPEFIWTENSESECGVLPSQVTEFAHDFLAAVDAERGEPVAWSYTSKITGAETLTHQPPDRVIEHEQFVIHPLYLAPQPTPQEVDDARRYRFLRDHKFKHNGHCLALVGPILWEETLDAAIDAAIAKEES